MAKELRFNVDARRQLEAGVNALAWRLSARGESTAGS